MASTTGDVRGGADRTIDTVGAMPDGWVLFSAIMIMFSGLWNAVEGFFGFFRAAYFIGDPVFGSLWIWSLLWLAFGVLGVAAGGAIMAGRSWGRWFGIIVVILNLFLTLLVIGTYPWWSLVVIVTDLLVLFGLTVHWKQGAAVA
jgi:hypothetical protein